MDNQDVQENFVLAKHTTAFQAKLFAILLVTHTEEARTTGHKIYIWSDNQAALKAIYLLRSRNSLVQECVDALDLLGHRKIYLI